MLRRAMPLIVILSLLCAALGSGVAVAQTTPPQVDDPMRAFSIVPPGQEGNVSDAELATGGFGPHYDDQLDMYAQLVNDDDVTEAELPTYFHSMQFGPQGDVEREYSPTEGATVYRDELGIPHIYAADLAKAGFALGYVSAEDRMWEMDVFRHAARGTLSEFVGPGENDAFLEMDIDTRREGYTEQEIRKMFDSLDEKFGPDGQVVQEGLAAYSDGVNAYIDRLKTDPTVALDCPVEYKVILEPCPASPEEWVPEDTLFLVVLQLRVFGETAGGELDNAAVYARLQDRLGRELGTRVFNDLLFQNEPRAATSIDRKQATFPSQDLGRVDPRSFAIPDDAVELAEQTSARELSRRRVLADLGLRAPSSNALLVSAGESATGNPLEVGAPQVGYAVPSFFMDIDVHVPDQGIHFRGPAVPGAAALIPLGRGTDYAWSLTTGFSDAVDVRAERLCNPTEEVTTTSNFYLYRGRCRRMSSREETFVVRPTAISPGIPRTETHTFDRTIHGPVFARGTVDGKPVAFVKERFFWKKEIDSVPQFFRWNTQVDSLADFRSAARDFTMSFNAFYADSEDIGYFHVGYYPRRQQGVHPSLPIWGTGRWEWSGRFPWRRHPKVVNPDQGWVANWNNKPARGWDNFDNFKFGSIHRVELLQDRMRELLDGPARAQLSDIVDVIRDAATRDARAVYLGRRMARWAEARIGSSSSDESAALRAVEDWVTSGAHRYNNDGDGEMDDPIPLLVFDTWYETLVHEIFDDELGDDFDQIVPAPISDYSPAEGSSFFYDFSSYLDILFDDDAAQSRFALGYCDDRGTRGRRETCPDMVAAALEAAVDTLKTDQGEDMSEWSKEAENIVFDALGAGSVDEIPWQNRGTHNHVVEILSPASG
jgi:acyl-homoserine lactone acylase PvdQ